MKKTIYSLLISIIGLLCLTLFSQPDNQNHLWIFNVGQGDSSLIMTAENHTILIDGGPDDKTILEMSNAMPYWQRTIDLIIISHNHSDHISGLVEVLRRYTVKEIWLSGAIHTSPEYEELLKIIREKNIPTRAVWVKSNAVIDDAKIEVLYPLVDQTGKMLTNQHDATVVTKIIINNHSLLFTGDLEHEQEQTIVDYHCSRAKEVCPALSAELLKVPHHGSKTSLLPSFLASINPKIAVISVGKNSFGHPSSTVLDKLKNIGATIYRTDYDGTLNFLITDKEIVKK